MIWRQFDHASKKKVIKKNTDLTTTTRTENNAWKKQEKNTSQSSSTNDTNTFPKATTNKDTNQLDQNDVDAQLRSSWTQGAVVEVYSRGKKRWMRGMVERTFVDDEGEWLEIRYGSNLVKEIPRDSADIRPLRARFKNNYTFTKDHVSRMMEVWEDVDLEGTRHLDHVVLEAVFRAFNLNLKVDELEKVFSWIDGENREAITVEQFIRWMTDSVETLEQRDMQKRMFDAIDRTVRGEVPMGQSLQEEEKKKKSKN